MSEQYQISIEAASGSLYQPMFCKYQKKKKQIQPKNKWLLLRKWLNDKL